MNSASAQLNIFRFSIGAVILALVLGWLIGGPQQALVVAILAILEISLSFENAVINASILRRMSDFWQEMFLTVGLLIAVVGMRLLFPVVIVVATSGLALGSVVDLALHHPAEYAHQLETAHLPIAAFGGMFLFMIFIDFLLDATKQVHWIETIEKPLARAGSLKLLPTLIGLVVLVGLAYGLSEHDTAVVLRAGLIGQISYLLVRGTGKLFEQWGGMSQTGRQRGKAVVKLTGRAAAASFVYLEVIDASFSFDGVVGAFALTNNVLVIALGLGVGAMFIRELTVWLVRHDTLTHLKYLEHGAYYAVGSLAVLLWAGLYVQLPEAVTGLVGAVIIVASVVESLQERRQQRA